MEPIEPNLFLFMVFTEWGYWAQVVSAAIFTYLVSSGNSEDRRKPWKIALKLLFLIGTFALLNLVMSLVGLLFRPLMGAGSWISYIGGVLLYARIFGRYEKNARSVSAALCFSTIILVNEIASVTGILLERAIPGFNIAIAKTTGNILLVPAAIYFRKYPVWKYYVSEPAAFLSVFANFLSAMTAIVYDMFRVNLFGPEEKSDSMVMMIVVFAALYLINTVIYQMIYHLSREETNVILLQTTQQMNKGSAALLAITENNLNELHKINHDIQNQYAYMRMLLKSGSYEALEKYFDELTGTFSEPLVPFVDCGNRVLDLIFNMENAKAQDAGVALDVKAAPPHDLPFRDVDLCNLYANLIDNALEACAAEKLPNAAVRVIVNVRGDYLFTQVTNPTTKTKTFLEKGSVTTKEDRRMHGKGMSIVRDIVHRYNGRYGARIEDGMYYAEFLLDLTYRQEDAHE